MIGGHVKLTSTSFTDGGKIPPANAFAVPDDPGPVALSDNRNPQLAWSDAPTGTASFVITCIDHDVPSSGEDVNQPDREVPADLPRVDFTHWLLADVPADVAEIVEGAHSDGVTAGGKAADAAPVGIHGVNDYGVWFGDDPDMGGVYCGYDGPAPPWNDSIIHHYEFTVYAIDVPSLGVAPGFSRSDLEEAMRGHVLASATITGAYATNPRLH